jgi:hypothetical protein
VRIVGVNLGCSSSFGLTERRLVMELAHVLGSRYRELVRLANVIEEPIAAGFGFAYLEGLRPGRVLVYASYLDKGPQRDLAIEPMLTLGSHEVETRPDGWTAAALANARKGAGALGLYVRYDSRTLPWFIEWKMMGEREYVVGMEPATNTVEGRAEERRNRRLRSIEPGETRDFHLEIGVLAGENDVRRFKREVAALART